MGAQFSTRVETHLGCDDASAKLREAAATKVQAAARGRSVRKDAKASQMRSIVRMRVNLPAGWRAVDGVPVGLELETRRHLALVGQQLVVSKMRAFGTSQKIGAPELILQTDSIAHLHRCEKQRTVFALTLGPGQSGLLFRAADEETCDLWMRALLNASASEELGGLPHKLGDE